MKKSLYGTRDAAQNWMDAYIKAMENMGFKRGAASPCAFWNARRELRVVVHGDDFTTLGHEEQLNWFNEEMRKHFECKHRGRIGPADDDEKEMRILNRIVTWTACGIQYEGDQRHVEIAMKELGLNEESREVGVPIAKDDDDIGSDVELDRSAAKQFRGIIARMNYLGQDRSQSSSQ